MDARQLRIGNWVCLNSKNVQIEGLNETGVNPTDSREGMEYDFYFNGDIFGNTLTPIPLTEQILLDCGFVKDVSSVDGQVFWHDSRKVLQGSIESFSWQNKPEYLHQLQNLYFALTGEELTYQPRPI